MDDRAFSVPTTVEAELIAKIVPSFKKAAD
jgi:hypothetical protein